MKTRTKAEAKKSGMKRATVARGVQYDTVTNTYIAAFYLGKKGGKPIRAHKTFLTKEEAVLARKAFDVEKAKGLPRNAEAKTTLEEYMREYIRDSVERKKIERTTERGYILICNRVSNTALGKKRLTSITTDDIEDYILLMRENFKAVTINKDIDLINRVMKLAIKNEIIKYNPATQVDRPQKDKYEVIPYTLEELEQLQKALLVNNNIALTVACMLAYRQGLRRGEIMGLTWDNVDIERGFLNIMNTRTQIGGEIIEKKPKTASSKRYITMGKELTRTLCEYKEYQKNKGILGKYVLVQDTGNKTNPTQLSWLFRKFIKQYGLRPVRFHDLRHTYATIAIENNIPISLVSASLGHSNISTTVNIKNPHTIMKRIKAA